MLAGSGPRVSGRRRCSCWCSLVLNTADLSRVLRLGSLASTRLRWERETLVWRGVMMQPSPAGWFPDPGGGHQWRYWDGTRWTDVVADQGVTTVEAVARPGVPHVTGSPPWGTGALGPRRPVEPRPAPPRPAWPPWWVGSPWGSVWLWHGPRRSSPCSGCGSVTCHPEGRARVWCSFPWAWRLLSRLCGCGAGRIPGVSGAMWRPATCWRSRLPSPGRWSAVLRCRGSWGPSSSVACPSSAGATPGSYWGELSRLVLRSEHRGLQSRDHGDRLSAGQATRSCPIHARISGRAARIMTFGPWPAPGWELNGG